MATCVFFNILDISALAAYIIYKENVDMRSHKKNDRRLFLRELGENLCLPSIQDRSRNTQAMRHFSTRSGVESILNSSNSLSLPAMLSSSGTTKNFQARDSTGRKSVVGVCQMCVSAPKKLRRKTRKSCKTCGKPVCDEHSISICQCKACVEM